MSEKRSSINRRNFIKGSALSSGALLLSANATSYPNSVLADEKPLEQHLYAVEPLDLSPAKWIWYPSERTLQNTIVLFRKDLEIKKEILSAKGWVAADSRYRFFLNGERKRWGPAPFDPRWMEADPIDLTEQLQPGQNVIGVEVLYYGQGDGTWPMGKPGFLFRLDIEYKDGEKTQIISDPSWFVQIARAWRPGNFKRWYLRSFQEEFDARKYPFGWSKTGYKVNDDWIPAMELSCPANMPASCANYQEYMQDCGGDRTISALRKRQIPLIKYSEIPVKKLVESYWLEWKRLPEEYFEFKTPNAFNATPATIAKETKPGEWVFELDGTKTAALTFEFEDQVVGFPHFTIDAPEGTTVEMLVHEAHQPGGPVIINSHFYSWTRLICKQGLNSFEEFDYESLRWVQFIIRNAKGKITLSNIGVRRRIYDWPVIPEIQLSEKPLQRLMDAAVNTLHNCAQEHIVDGMARERQQYSGDCGHTLHAIYFAFGETRLPARFISTYSQGQTKDGYFFDSWPAYDRFARLSQRQLNMTHWGSIIDHGIGFNFDCYHHYLYTGDLGALKEPYPRLLKFTDYLRSIRKSSGLLPVEDAELGNPSVWIDHIAYKKQSHKQCVFNLYSAAMLMNALSPICKAFGDNDKAKEAYDFGKELYHAAAKHFWSDDHQMYIINKPWLAEEKQIRTCDRSLATSILFDMLPNNDATKTLQKLVECPSDMGFAYPANAGWRLWALAKSGRTDVVADDLRKRWATMDSVILNNTLQEDWTVKPDSSSQWSHCPLVPLYMLYMGLAGIRPLEPGFKKCQIRPQPADIEKIELTAQTVQGPIQFASAGKKGDREIVIAVPSSIQAELVLDSREKITLKSLREEKSGLTVYSLPKDKTVLKLKYT